VNSSLQLAADPPMRGRVMALYSIVFLGSTPIGGPLAGWLSQTIDPRAALVLTGVAGLVAAIGARAAFRASTPGSWRGAGAEDDRRERGRVPARAS
jgi:MFS family permease